MFPSSSLFPLIGGDPREREKRSSLQVFLTFPSSEDDDDVNADVEKHPRKKGGNERKAKVRKCDQG